MKAIKKYEAGGVGPGKKKKRKAVKERDLTAYEKQRMRKQAEKEAYKKEQEERRTGERASFYEQRGAKMDKRLPKADKKNKKKADKLRDKQTRLAGESQKAKENLKSIYDSQGVPRNERTTVQVMDSKGGLKTVAGMKIMSGAEHPLRKKKRK